jgi:O-antigen/teichoic acid export membrane protein
MIRIRHLTKDIFIYGLASATRSLVGLLLVPIYTRLFLPGEYGTIDTITTVAAFIMLVISLGINSSFGIYFYDPESTGDRPTIVTTTLTAYATLSISAALLMTFVGPGLSALLFGSREATVPLTVACWNVPATMLTGFTVDLLRLNRKAWTYSALLVGNLLLGVVLSILFVVILGWGITGAFSGLLLSNILIMPIGFWMTRDLVKGRISWSWLKKLLVLGLPLVPVGFCGWFMAYANRYFLLYFGSTSDIGLLAVGNKTSAPLVLFTSAFLIAWGPFALSIQNQENAREVYGKVWSYLIVAAGTIGLVFSVFAKEMLMLFTTARYVSGHVVGGLMVLQVMADASYYVVSIGLTITKKTRLLGLAVPAAAAGSILFNLILIPPFGYVGGAIANTLSYMVSALVVFVLAQRQYRVPYELSRILKVLLLFVACWLLSLLIDNGKSYSVVVNKILILLGYTFLLFLVRAVTLQEVALARDWLRRQFAALRSNPEPTGP